MGQAAEKYDMKNDADRIAYAAEISQVLSTLDNAVEREIYTVRAAETAGFTPEAMRNEVNRAFREKQTQGAAGADTTGAESCRLPCSRRGATCATQICAARWPRRAFCAL